MSMLAERKIKQKWSLNPRGKAWSEDANKFGQKMLEKMGWSRGKGLGAKENGVTEHVKVSYKNDSKGMGYKESDDQWTEHDSNFNALLQSLSGKTDSEEAIKLSSLEQKSQGSKVRVHYKKFTRGKDLSRCSEKDLANIFGKRTLKDAPPKPEEEEEIEECKSEGFMRNGGSMVDYFKKKRPNFNRTDDNTESEEECRIGFGYKTPEDVKSKKKRKSNGEIPNGTPKKMKCEEPEGHIGLSNPAFDPLCNKMEVQRHMLNTIAEEDHEEFEEKTIEQEDSFKVKRKKKKQKSRDESSSDDEKKKRKEIDSSNRNDCVSDTFDVKNNKQDGASIDNFDSPKPQNAYVNVNFDDLNNQSGYVNESYEIKRKKKKKNKIDNANFDSSNQNALVSDTFEVKRNKEDGASIDNSPKPQNGYVNGNFGDSTNQSSYVDESYEIKRKKKKNNDIDNSNFDSSNSAKSHDGYVNGNFDDSSNRSGYVDESYEIKRKKKKKNEIDNPNFDSSNSARSQNGYVNGNFDDSSNQSGYVDESYEIKRKKKKKKGKEAIDNPNFDDSVSGEGKISYVDDNFEVRRKKKKNKESGAVDNPNFHDSSDGDGQSSYVNDNVEVKREKSAFAIDNPSFNELSSPNDNSTTKTERKNGSDVNIGETDGLNFDLMLNVTATPRLQKTNLSTVSTNSKSSVKRRKSVRFSDVNEERIIPNKEDIENRNELFDINSMVIENGLKNSRNDDLTENIDEIAKKIDGFQAEIENDINEAKMCQFIGEVGGPDGDNEKLPDGTKLRFRFARFGKIPHWDVKKPSSKAKSSYKHLIKGDVIVGFKNTNLHEIQGYGCNIKRM